MASKFKIWVDQANVNNVQDATTFAGDPQRETGFLSGTAASSIRVNTALRQANLIACALMELVDPTGTKDVKSSVSDIKTMLNTYLTQTLVANNATYASKVGTSDSHPPIGDKDRIIRVDSNGVIVGDGYYVPKLNGSDQTSAASFYAPTSAGTYGYVLVSNGTGAAPTWEDSHSLVAGDSIRAYYASSDTSKGTIEERLTRLGFRQGSISLPSSPIVTDVTKNEIKRQGNYVIINFSSYFINMPISAEYLIGNISQEFRPTETILIHALVREDTGEPFLPLWVRVYPEGTVKVYCDQMINNCIGFNFNCGFEADPITS